MGEETIVEIVELEMQMNADFLGECLAGIVDVAGDNFEKLEENPLFRKLHECYIETLSAKKLGVEHVEDELRKVNKAIDAVMTITEHEKRDRKTRDLLGMMREHKKKLEKNLDKLQKELDRSQANVKTRKGIKFMVDPKNR